MGRRLFLSSACAPSVSCFLASRQRGRDGVTAMAQVLEWFQCKKCGRRQRWTADIAGKDVTCSCGNTLRCPLGAGLDGSHTGAPVLSDTLVEDVEAASAAQPAQGDWLKTIGVEHTEVRSRLMTPQERQNAKQMIVWTLLAAAGLLMFVHAVFVMPYLNKYYVGVAIVLSLGSFWKFHVARRRWQKGRGFMRALQESLGGDE